jgi:hypothetical protein
MPRTRRSWAIPWSLWGARPETAGAVMSAAERRDDGSAREEQAALRRVATMVAHGDAPIDVFKAECNVQARTSGYGRASVTSLRLRVSRTPKAGRSPPAGPGRCVALCRANLFGKLVIPRYVANSALRPLTEHQLATTVRTLRACVPKPFKAHQFCLGL